MPEGNISIWVDNIKMCLKESTFDLTLNSATITRGYMLEFKGLMIFEKNLNLNIFCFLYYIYQTFLIQIRNERNMTINVQRSACKVLCAFVRC